MNAIALKGIFISVYPADQIFLFCHESTTLPDNFSDCSAETDRKRLEKPFYSKTPLLKTDANRFSGTDRLNKIRML